MKEKWLIQAKKADFNAIAAKFNISPITARLIRNRDIISDNEINSYLNGSLEKLHSPWLLKDMSKAVEIILDKISKGVLIRVIGDYDIDGVCSGNILVKGFERLGACVSFDVPDRILDGYGINDRIIDDAIADGIDTIVTCDNGIAAYDVIEKAKENGITVIITDHHDCPPKIPNADAVIDAKQTDCKYPFKEICGAVVAYKLIQALYEKSGISDDNLEELIELAAIATIGDVVDLKDENRIIASYGLKRISNTSNPGIRALIEVNNLSDKQISSYHIGFVIGPCLNAGGRLDTAMKSFELLYGGSADCMKNAIELKELNDERKQMTIDNVQAAIDIMESHESYEKDKVLVVYLPECHESLAGIVAGRIRERYYKPTFVITDSLNMLKGSGRSIEGYNMYQELLNCSKLLEKFGGHEMAAGLSLKPENLEKLRKVLNEKTTLTQEQLTNKVWIDVAMPFNYVTEQIVEELRLLEPFGKGNPKPIFAERNVSIKRITVFGANRNVIRINMINDSGFTMEGTYFADENDFRLMLEEKYGTGETKKAFEGKDNSIRLSITYYPELNEYKGNRYLRVVISKIM